MWSFLERNFLNFFLFLDILIHFYNIYDEKICIWLYTVLQKKLLKKYAIICIFKSKLSSYKNIRYAHYDNELMLAISLFLISKCLCLCVSHTMQLTLNGWREFQSRGAKHGWWKQIWAFWRSKCPSMLSHLSFPIIIDLYRKIHSMQNIHENKKHSIYIIN